MPPPTKLPKLAKVARDALEDLKGQDIRVLDVQKLTTVTDTMIICTGTSNRHVKSLAQNVAEDAKKAGYRPMGIEGQDAGEWVLVDLGGVVVHVMQAQARAFYQLEKLWTVEEDEAPAKPKKAKADKADKKTARKTAGTTATGGRKAASGAARKGGAAKKAGANKSGASRKTAGSGSAARKAPAKKAAGKAPAKRTAAKGAARSARR